MEILDSTIPDVNDSLKINIDKLSLMRYIFALTLHRINYVVILRDICDDLWIVVIFVYGIRVVIDTNHVPNHDAKLKDIPQQYLYL